jgi:hypothetical protein
LTSSKLTVLKICSPSWPPDTNILPSNTVTPAALRQALISVTTVHLTDNNNTKTKTNAQGRQGKNKQVERMHLNASE